MTRYLIASLSLLSLTSTVAAAATAADRCLLQVQNTEKIPSLLQSQGLHENDAAHKVNKTAVPEAASSIAFGSDDAGLYAHADKAAHAHQHEVEHKGSHLKCGIAVVLVFFYALFAFRSIVIASNTDTNDDVPREKIWDIAKFILMAMVVKHHGAKDYYSTDWYHPWFMPAFVMVSGITTQATKDTLSVRVFRNVARDLVINNFIFVALKAIVHVKAKPSLWFLWAIAVYRLSILPVSRLLSSLSGHVVGNTFTVAGAVIIPFMCARILLIMPQSLVSEVQFRVESIAFVNDAAMVSIAAMGMFYALGLAIPRQVLKDFLHTYIAFVGGVAVMLVFVSYQGSSLVRGQPSLQKWCAPQSKHNCLNEPFAFFVAHFAERALLSLSFLACMAPLALEAVKPVGDQLAKLGERTLYAYWVHQFFCHTCKHEIASALSLIHQPLLVNLVVFCATVALCSPLTEWCFRWAVSPQWIFDVCRWLASLLVGKTADSPAKV